VARLDAAWPRRVLSSGRELASRGSRLNQEVDKSLVTVHTASAWAPLVRPQPASTHPGTPLRSLLTLGPLQALRTDIR